MNKKILFTPTETALKKLDAIKKKGYTMTDFINELISCADLKTFKKK